MTTTSERPLAHAETSMPDGLQDAIGELIEVEWDKDWASTDRGDDVWYTPEITPSIVHVEFHMDFTELIEIPKEITGATEGEIADPCHDGICHWTATRGELVAMDRDAETITFAYEVIAD